MLMLKKFRSIVFKYPILSPLFFIVFFVLSGFYETQDYALPVSLLQPVLCIGVIGLLLFILFRKIAGSNNKAALLTDLILLPALFFGPARYLLQKISFIEPVTRYRYLLILFPFVIIFIAIKIIKSDRQFIRSNQLLCSFGFLIVIIELLKIGYHPFSNNKWNAYISPREKIAAPANLPAQLPNVYYLLFDMHTGSESLEKYWNYEDTVLINHLTSKGFCVLKNARSNYNYTLYSLASTFNMQHLNELPKYKSNITTRINSLGSVIRDNSVAELFQSIGYDIINLSPFDIGLQQRFYTRYYTFSLGKYLWDKTLPGKICTELLWNAKELNEKISNLFSFQDRDNAVCSMKVFSKLNELNKTLAVNKKPSFIYAHFLLPHYPYHYNRKGEWRSIENDRIDDKDSYLDQLIYTDELIKKITDSILINSVIPPVIIIQGDHGFNMLKGADKIKEANSILNAYYFPGGCKKEVYETITPVNTFRVLFNSAFHFQFKLQEDKSFYVNEFTFDCAEDTR
jgi:hypothetical protein